MANDAQPPAPDRLAEILKWSKDYEAEKVRFDRKGFTTGALRISQERRRINLAEAVPYLLSLLEGRVSVSAPPTDEIAMRDASYMDGWRAARDQFSAPPRLADAPWWKSVTVACGLPLGDGYPDCLAPRGHNEHPDGLGHIFDGYELVQRYPGWRPAAESPAPPAEEG